MWEKLGLLYFSLIGFTKCQRGGGRHCLRSTSYPSYQAKFQEQAPKLNDHIYSTVGAKIFIGVNRLQKFRMPCVAGAIGAKYSY